MVKKRNRVPRTLIIVIILFLFVVSVQKKEGIETVEPSFRDYVNSDFISIAGDAENSMFIIDLPLTATSLGQSKIDKANEIFVDFGIAYALPYAISDCDQYKAELQQVANIIKNEVNSRFVQLNDKLQLFSSADQEKMTNNINTLLRFNILDSAADGKRSVILEALSQSQISSACDQFELDFPSENQYSAILRDACLYNGNIELFDQVTCDSVGGRQISVSQSSIIRSVHKLCSYAKDKALTDDIPTRLYSVCEDNFLFVTFGESMYNKFIDYSGVGSGWGRYRDYYMNNLGGGELVSSFTLDACLSVADCLSTENCNGFKCVDESCVPGTWSPATSKVSCGETFTQVDNVCGTSRQNTGKCSSGFGCSRK